ncbi:MAG TPA: adenylate cyclase regulatory domain-containing protein [Solirubrobacteraceae bacterium]|jgi:adenylate cyclase|nr:adenylate cyclase regulatory domain-containing protein [Solirubrobacteraceae bacterium]
MADWDAEGLLEGLEDERDREARRRLLDELDDEGFALEELRRAAREDRLVLLPVERALGDGPPKYTLAELAERAGASRDLALANLRAAGVPVPRDEDVVFHEVDVESLRRVVSLTESGLPRESVFDLVRATTTGMARIASATRTVIGESLLRPGDTELDLARRYTAATESLAPMIGPALEYAFTYHLREAIRNDVVDRTMRTTGRLDAGEDITVAFADLVGFTRLGEERAPEDLGHIVDRLGELANDVAQRPVQLVKLIGDAAMLVSPKPAPLVDAALALVEGVEQEGEDFPPLRAGVASGAALTRGGDWYGRPVNLASRITGIARPGSVLTTGEVREALGENGYRWSSAGKRKLKGVRADTRLYRVRPGERNGDEAGR